MLDPISKQCSCGHNNLVFLAGIRNSNNDLEIENLPRLPEEILQTALAQSDGAASSQLVKCVKCHEKSVKAVVYCADCMKSFCHQHAEVRQRYIQFSVAT